MLGSVIKKDTIHKICRSIIITILLSILIRDPDLFKKITFLIDRFHNRNHLCNPIYSIKIYETEEVNKIYSQSCEQLFSISRRISTLITYMRFDSIFFNTRYFLSCWNIFKKKTFPHHIC